MANKICTVPEIDVSKFKFKINDAKGPNAKSGKSIYFYHNGKPLYFQTPVTTTPFGITCWDENQAVPKFTMNITLGDNSFLEKIQEIENRIIDEAFNDSQNWFKKKYANRDVVAELFSSSIRWSKDKETGEVCDKYPPTMKLNMSYINDAFTCEGYQKVTIKDQPQQINPLEISRETIYKNASVIAIIQCSGIWVIGNKFGATFRAVQLMRIDNGYNTGPKKITGYAFIDDSDEECDA